MLTFLNPELLTYYKNRSFTKGLFGKQSGEQENTNVTENIKALHFLCS